MGIEIDPVVGTWYTHLDKGQRFVVIAIDESDGLIETQHFDGDLEEISLEDWYEQDIDIAEEPENWSGVMDIGTKDDFGTEITDTEMADWNEDLEDIHLSAEENTQEPDSEE